MRSAPLVEFDDSLFANLAVQKGYLTEDQVDDCLQAQATMGSLGMKSSLSEVAVKKNCLTREQLKDILKGLVKANR